MKVYRGSPTAARNYVEADRARADDYYLAEGSGVAEHYSASSSGGLGAARLSREGTLDGDAYESWVAGRDTTGAPKGRLRTDDQAVRFVEVVINGPKTWSLAAGLHPEIAHAYDDAQDRAAHELMCWLAEHSTTRVGPRGRQVQVPVERIEGAVIRHYTSHGGPEPRRNRSTRRTQMANYSVARRPDGRWRARYLGPDHKERSRHFDRKSDAERWARAEVARIDRGEWTDPDRGRLTVGEYSEEWLRSKVRIRPSTRLMYDVVLRNQVLPTWGATRLDAVRHEDVSIWVADLHRNGLSAARTRHAWVVLSQVLELAVRSRRIPNNQAKGVELPALPSKSERDKTRFLNEREVWALANAAGEQATTILVLAWCGLRIGELAALRCSNLDVEKRELRVSKTLSESNGKSVEGPPKTESSIRTVPVPGWLCTALAVLTIGRDPDDYLFTAPQGGPLRARNWRTRVFDVAVKRAGLASQQRGDMLRPHDLRHTCASLHIKHGTPPKVLSTMLGHASVAITLDRYGHLYPGDAHLYVDRLGEVALAARADYSRTGDISTTPTGPEGDAQNGA